jgi:hypothetical protein
MDSNRFDAIAKSLITEMSRRRTLGGLVGGTLGVLGLGGADEIQSAKSGKCKQTCGLCEDCAKGKCRKKKSGKKVCKAGQCQPRRDLEDCPAGQVRNPLTCGCCQTNGQICTATDNNNCCSEGCFDIGTVNICRGRPEGLSCDFGAQCESGVCSNGKCT